MMIRTPTTLRSRLLLAMMAFAVAASMLMALLVVAFAYGIEDAGFNAQLDREWVRQMAAMDAGEPLPEPADPALRRVSSDDLPADLAAVLVEEPGRVEYTAASGRHYHFRALDVPGHSRMWLLYDVTDRLIVRPSAVAIWTVLAAVTLLVMLVGCALAVLLSRRVTQPLSALVQAVQQAAPDALKLGLPAPTGPAEVAVLAAHLNALMARLGDFLAREQAFTRDASHEIRTPLAVMRIQLDHLLTSPDLPASALASLTGLHHAVDDLQRIVETLLWLAREDVLPSTVETVALRPLVERAIVDQSLRLDRDDVVLSIEVPDDARLIAPRGALVLLVGNVVGNALAHAAPGTISIWWDDASLRVCNPRHTQSDAYPVLDEGHAGFGLSILRRVADRSGLKVVVTVTDAHFDVGIAAKLGASQSSV